MSSPFRRAPSHDRLTPPADAERVDWFLAATLDEARRRHGSNPHVAPLLERLSEFVLHGGKRIRPRLCLASYRLLTGDLTSPPRPVWAASACLELFHAFMLVHDDLIDGSVIRRNRPTLPEAIRQDHEHLGDRLAAKRGADLGLIGGDLLFALGIRLINDCGLEPNVLVRANRLLCDMLFETGLGEALDVLYDDRPLGRLTGANIEEAYILKTARYSLSGPLVLGAVMAQADSAIESTLDRFGDLLGLGYQIQNDLDALEVDPEVGDHSDLDTGKRTLVLWLAHERLAEAGRAAMHRALGMEPGPERRRRLLELIEASGAVVECQRRLERLREEAVDLLANSPLDRTQRAGLMGLIALLPSSRRVAVPTVKIAAASP